MGFLISTNFPFDWAIYCKLFSPAFYWILSLRKILSASKECRFRNIFYSSRNISQDSKNSLPFRNKVYNDPLLKYFDNINKQNVKLIDSYLWKQLISQKISK